MDMAADDQIGTRLRPSADRRFVAMQQVARVFCRDGRDGMMRDHYAKLQLRRAFEPARGALDLFCGDFAVRVP
jgi:hypothetical protein